MRYVRGFGLVSGAERARADTFLRALTGQPRAGRARPSAPWPALPAAREMAAEDVAPVAPFWSPLDAAVVWGGDKAYFFKGDKYVRYSMGQPEGADADYPRKIKGNWGKLAFESDIDAVILWNPTTAYFFKDDEFVKYAVSPTEAAEPPQKIKGNWPGLWDKAIWPAFWDRALDTAIVWNDGYAYFFKGDEYVRIPVRDPIAKQKADPPRKIHDKWPHLWERGLDAALLWNNGMAYFFKCSQYIGYAVDGTRANRARSTRANWTGLIGSPAGWRLNRIPPRPSGAKGGKAFFGSKPDEKDPVPVAAWFKRENDIVAELLSGNIPDALLRWVKVDLSHTFTQGSRKGSTITGAVWVLPDYLSIGDDTDYVHVPLDQLSAQRVASAFGLVLPTPRICHAIYSSPQSRKFPFKLLGRDYWQTDLKRRKAPVGREQASTAAYVEHSVAIRDAMAKSTPAITLGMLVAGHKKDVVITKEVLAPHNSHKVSFHGFYDDQGFPHEPCHESRWVDAQGRPLPNCPKDGTSLAHPAQVNGYMFSDYSQGVRLVHPIMEVDGEDKCVAHVLAHPELSYLISSEGPFSPARIPKPAIKLWV